MQYNYKTLRRSQELRKSMTTEERHLWYDYLKTYPIQFKRQYPIGCYFADFFCYQAGLVIELDGSQHCTPELIKYDNERTTFLNEQGYRVLRFSNLDVMRNFHAVCSAIDLAVKKRLQG